MANKKLGMNVNDNIHSATVAAGATKVADVMIAWTTADLTKAQVLATVDKLRAQLQATPTADF